MTTILTSTAEHAVAARDGVWIGAGDAERLTGWSLKPEGMCRADLCVPLRPEMVRGREVDIEAFWKALGGPVVKSDDGEVWALGAPADERNAALEGLEAPDFTLPDVDGVPRTLLQLRGRKVLLATWASW